jgi:bacterioferritin (cytochrome b1)
MNIEQRFPWFLWAVSAVIWRLPGRAAVKMADFSHTEAGSSLDMLAAAELTSRPDLRRKFFRHCLDEYRHARLFAQRALALAGRRGRAHAVLEDANYIPAHGIRGGRSLYETLGELQFLGFVWLHELRGARQFDVYTKLMADDPLSARMFESIAHDERFHIQYSRKELDKLRASGLGLQVAWAILRVRTRRLTDAWLRFGHGFGHFMASGWLALIYLVVLAPFAALVAYTESLPGGLVASAPEPSAAERARSQS